MPVDEKRKVIAALQMSLDGLIEGPNGELDWIGSWEDSFELVREIDTCVLGARMYPGYAEYWRAVLEHPDRPLPFTGRTATRGEVEYARFADATPHLVLSRTLDAVDWKPARVIHDLDVIRELKRQPGRHIHAVGGASLVSSLMNEQLVDELRLTVHPVVLGQGKPLFSGVTEPHPLTLRHVQSLAGGRVSLVYDAGA